MIRAIIAFNRAYDRAPKPTRTLIFFGAVAIPCAVLPALSLTVGGAYVAACSLFRMVGMYGSEG